VKAFNFKVLVKIKKSIFLAHKGGKERCVMKRLNCKKIRLVLIGFMAAIVIGGGNLRADFTFGEPVNLGPPINTEYDDSSPFISADGLSLYFTSLRPGGSGDSDIWVTRRASTKDDWGEPVNLGPTINTPSVEWHPSITADGLEIYFDSDRHGGEGYWDLWMAKRESTDDDWSTPVNLGSTINTSGAEESSSISPDGLVLMWSTDRPDGYGWNDTWMASRATRKDSWSEPVNLGPMLNTENLEANAVISADSLVLFFTGYPWVGGYGDFDIWMSRRPNENSDWNTPANLGPTINTVNSEYCPSISSDGTTLYFSDWPLNRPGGQGGEDLWQAPIIPIVDLNADGIVDSADMCIVVDHWGEDYSLCDVGPMPWGDGVVDVQDLIVIAEHLFEEIPTTEPNQ
jgi:hypothetical protein